MLSSLASKLGLTSPPTRADKTPRHVTYTHNPVPIPPTFLTTPPAKPIVSNPIDFANSPLPQYTGHIALTLDNVLSPEECAQLIQLAEASVPLDDTEGASSASAWRPAMVSLGPGIEAPAPGYRESDRIIWNQQVVMDRLWERCRQVEGLEEMLASVQPDHHSYGPGQWEFRRINERMRFLKYSPGQYFKPHCDGPYYYEDKASKAQFMTFYTIQLYLNDSAANDPQSDLVGGATAFLSRRGDARIDVNPKAGSVLIFQHRGLFHEGAMVDRGTKYTMRTDILYEWVKGDKEGEQESSK